MAREQLVELFIKFFQDLQVPTRQKSETVGSSTA